MKRILCAFLAMFMLLSGCASQQGAAESSETATQPGSRIVKSRDGSFEGEIVGTPAPRSKFARLQIGMLMKEVHALIGPPDKIHRYETNKIWIPFYYGNDAKRIQAYYKGEGCLTFSGGNVFGSGARELMRITADPAGDCM